MAARPLQVPARYYARVIDLLRAAGGDPTPLLQAAGIDAQLIGKPDAMLRFDRVEALVDTFARMTGRLDLAFDLGPRLKVSSHSILGFAMLSSPTIDHALRLVARFYRLISPAFRMRYRRDAERAELAFEPVTPMSNTCLTFHLETMAVAAHWDLYELLREPLPPYDLYVPFPAPAHARRYRELVGARCHFAVPGAPGLRLVFPADLVAHTPATADVTALQMAESRCRLLVQTVVAGGDVAGWVRMMLRESVDGMPALGELARTLNLSPRTLDRYLGREGVSFRALSRAVRHAKACGLLADGRLSVTQIAHEIGYTDAANFTRAFRRECGTTPTEFRRTSSSPRKRGPSSSAHSGFPLLTEGNPCGTRE